MQRCLAKVNLILSTTLLGSILLAFSVPWLQLLLTSYISGSPSNLDHSYTFHLFAYVGPSTGSLLPLLHMLSCFLTSHQIPQLLPFHLPLPTCFMVSYSSLSPVLLLVSSSYPVKSKPNIELGLGAKWPCPATLDLQSFSQEQKPSAYIYAYWVQKLASIAPLEPSTQFQARNWYPLVMVSILEILAG